MEEAALAAEVAQMLERADEVDTPALSDAQQLVPAIEAIERTLGDKPKQILADAGSTCAYPRFPTGPSQMSTRIGNLRRRGSYLGVRPPSLPGRTPSGSSGGGSFRREGGERGPDLV